MSNFTKMCRVQILLSIFSIRIFMNKLSKGLHITLGKGYCYSSIHLNVHTNG